MQPLNVALIYGSARSGRFCDVIANWVGAHVAGAPDLALLPIDPAAAWRTADEAALVQLRQQLARADAFIVVTPEYNHGYPAPLKWLIDAGYAEWHAKPVGFVCYGGVSGGLRAVEQLRQVFAELHAVTLRDTVSFAHPQDRFGADGVLPAPEARRAERSLARMLAQLRWWGGMLRAARAAVPYQQVLA
ncbi:NAD(P)H-dependent oxidoreductase [Chitiniphilus purpureus]|uniref:NAD(P)H-dependent oxidoreductase n=1 Tax=Chitiniphilus purpureus TaxID=2981137 RepID=A0ABY6DSE6_9NEIS|nr:NAD(P)H-dependent oxidoreductase [Chitiniphilus sp. CD1]UXY17285.1 NAD(P)H-dependent oxidoreductase [Chitiniphilus sp. CD1]